MERGNEGGPPPPAATRLVYDDFEIDLGPGWKTDHDENGYIFNDEAGLRQVAVSVLAARHPIDPKELRETAVETTRMRQDALKELSNGKAEFSSIETAERDGGVDITFSAVDPVNEVQVKATLLARPYRFVTVSFNKYSPYLPEEEFNRQAAGVLAAVKIKD